MVFEDVVFDNNHNNSYVTPFEVTYTYSIRLNMLLSNTTSSNTTSLNSEHMLLQYNVRKSQVLCTVSNESVSMISTKEQQIYGVCRLMIEAYVLCD